MTNPYEHAFPPKVESDGLPHPGTLTIFRKPVWMCPDDCPIHGTPSQPEPLMEDEPRLPRGNVIRKSYVESSRPPVETADGYMNPDPFADDVFKKPVETAVCQACGLMEDALCEHVPSSEIHKDLGPFPIHVLSGAFWCMHGHQFSPSVPTTPKDEEWRTFWREVNPALRFDHPTAEDARFAVERTIASRAAAMEQAYLARGNRAIDKANEYKARAEAAEAHVTTLERELEEARRLLLEAARSRHLLANEVTHHGQFDTCDAMSCVDYRRALASPSTGSQEGDR